VLISPVADFSSRDHTVNLKVIVEKSDAPLCYVLEDGR